MQAGRERQGLKILGKGHGGKMLLLKKCAQSIFNKAWKENEKQERALAAAEKRPLNEKAKQAKGVGKQAQNELSIITIRPNRLVVGPKLLSLRYR